MEVANVIKRQIGVVALMSCGAHDFVAIEDGLRFKVGGRRRWCQVVLEPSDTYYVHVFRLKGAALETVSEYGQGGIYADQLAEIIRKEADR